MSPPTWPSLGNLLRVTLHAQTRERFTRESFMRSRVQLRGTNEDLWASAGNRPPRRAAGAEMGC